MSIESFHKPKAPQAKVKAIAIIAVFNFETANTVNPIKARTPSQPISGIVAPCVGIEITSRMKVTNPSIICRIGLKKYLNAAPSVRLPRMDLATSPTNDVNGVFCGTAISNVNFPLKSFAKPIQITKTPPSNQLRLISRLLEVPSARLLIPEFHQSVEGCHLH